MKTILPVWIIIFCLSHLVFLLICLVWCTPSKSFVIPFSRYIHLALICRFELLIILGIVAFHLLQVNLIDPITTELISNDAASVFAGYERDLLQAIQGVWHPLLLTIFVSAYIIVYPFTLWFSPLLFLVTESRNAMKTLAYGLALIYAIALPFYLFLPVTNVYTYLGTASALETVIPSIDSFFYATTTTNNCFPSLHVAVSLLIAKSVSKTRHHRYILFTSLSALLVIIAVIYLAIHWITDVVAGVLLALGVFYLLDRYVKEK